MSYYPPQPGQEGQHGAGWPQQQQPSYYPPTEPGQQQQPFTSYPQWTEVPPPPPTPQFIPPKKKSRKTLFIVLGVIAAVVFFGCIGISALASLGNQTTTNQSSATQATQQQPTQAQVTPTPAVPTPTPIPTHAPQWVTTHTFTGNGTKKTGYFTVPNDWKLVWKCDPTSFYGGQYNVIIGVTGSDGSLIDPAAVNTICKTGNTGDSTDEHQGGKIYLDVNSEGAWTIQVQELK
jgi:hypothetical protein